MLVVCILLATLALLGWYFFTRDEEKQVGEHVAPNFSLPDASGKMISLDSLEAELVVINFWASWSPYSKDELKYLVELKKEFGDRIEIVCLNRDTDPLQGKQFLQQENIGEELLFVYDAQDEYFKKVSGFAVPETVFLTEGDEIVYHKHGPMTYDEMKARVEDILAH